MPKKAKTWKQRDGTEIQIKDMADRHIKNAMAMLERMAEADRWTITPPIFQGEMAQYYADQDYDRMMRAGSDELASDLYPVYDDLIEELERRETKSKGGKGHGCRT